MGLTFKSATEQTATVAYSAQFNIRSDAYDLHYSGSINGVALPDKPSGEVTIKNLVAGTSNQISGSITCTYKYDVITTNADGSTSKTTHTGSQTVSLGTLTVYTHPNTFTMGASTDSNSPNSIICNVLSKAKIDAWITCFQKAYHWKTQQGTNYGVDLTVKQEEPVTAQWFNKCMVAMNLLGKGSYKTDYQGGPQGDLITATAINQLNIYGFESMSNS